MAQSAPVALAERSPVAGSGLHDVFHQHGSQRQCQQGHYERADAEGDEHCGDVAYGELWTEVVGKC